MDQLPIFIPVGIRLNLISLFNQFDNRIALCNIALLYSTVFDQRLNVQQFGCANMDQLVRSMKHLFKFSYENQVIFVECCIPLHPIKLIKQERTDESRIDLNCLDDLANLFEPNDFNHLNKILQKTDKLKQPISITQFENDFVQNSGTAFNFIKYGFQSSADFFITFSKLFTFTSDDKNLRVELGNRKFKANVLFSLGNILVQLNSTNRSNCNHSILH